MKVLVALGGNAILRHGETGSAEEQLENVRRTRRQLARLFLEGSGLRLSFDATTLASGPGPRPGKLPGEQ